MTDSSNLLNTLVKMNDNKKTILIELLINNFSYLIKIDNEIDKICKSRSIKSPYKFKINNYKKWILYLKSIPKTKYSALNNSNNLYKYVTDEKPHYNGLLKRIKLLSVESELPDIEESLNKLKDLDPENKLLNQQLNNNNTTGYNVEAIPKNLAAEGDRPDNEYDAAIYDLRLIHGFGPVSAKKAVDNGCRLKYLLEEWLQYKEIYEDENLMISKMKIPPEYTKDTFDTLSLKKKHMILHSALMNRLKQFKWLKLLKHDQLIGIKYFHHISHKIPRDEVIKMESLLIKFAHKLNPDLKIQCCGSYRRGRQRSGDIDALMCHPELKTKEDIEHYFTYKNNILQVYVDLLTEYGFINDHITDGGHSKYMGLCKLKSDRYKLYRRIDIRFVPFHSYGTALLYFTGSKNFNTTMRTKAIKLGYTLSEYGLFKTIKENGKKCKGEHIPTPSEEDVFNILKMDYKNPKDRDI